MPDLPHVVVDIHSHVFNAEDLPIDGFVKRLAPVPGLLTSILSRPLDALTQWVAPRSNREVEALLALLGPQSDEEGIPGLDLLAVEAVLVSDAELDRLFEAEWQRMGLRTPAAPGDLEGVQLPPDDEELAASLAAAPPAELHELEAWLEEWDPDLRAVVQAQQAAEAQQEGVFRAIGGAVGYVRAAKRAVGLYVAALRLITRYRFQVAAELARTYPTVSLFVPALVDFAHTTSDRPAADIRQQITVHSLVAKVSMAGRLPGSPHVRIAPFVGFDPYREVAETALSLWNPDRGAPNRYVPYADPTTAGEADRYRRDIAFDLARARPLRTPTGPWEQAVLDLTGVMGSIDLTRHAVELGGFVGVKLYPPAGFLPMGNALRFTGTRGEQLDAALHALYAYCVAMDVPILTHAAHSNGFEPGYNGFAGPAGWELVLAQYPDLRLCLGHFGHLHGVGNDPTQPSLDGWPRRFVDLIDRYPNVYADVGNSKLPLSEKYKVAFVALLQALLGGDDPDDVEMKRRRRLLYGSDFWMNTMSPGHKGFLTGFLAPISEGFDAGTTEAFMGRNGLRFLGFTGDDDEPDPTNQNRQRLVAFHGPHATPAWLPAG